MAKLRCDNVKDGLRASEVVAVFRDFQGRRHFLRVERDFLSEENGVWFLPVGVVHVDPKSSFVLVELPHEAETGANRLWVIPEQVEELFEVFA